MSFTSSTAVRARQTWDLACAQWGTPPPVRHDRRLYAAGVADLLAVVHQAPAEVGTLLLVIVPAVLAERHGPARGLAFVEANVLSYVGALLAPVTVWAVVQVASWRLVALPACLILLVSALALRSADFVRWPRL